jgi:hypothetical protein
MGDVIKPPQWNDPTGPHDYDNLGPITPQMVDDMYWLANALKLGSIEVVEGRLCGQCQATDSERCYYPACPLYVAPETPEDDGA